MSRNYHRRRGMTSIAEVLVSIMLFVILMATMISLFSTSGRLTNWTERSYAAAVTTEEFADIVREDVKSSFGVSLNGSDLVVSTAGGSVVYIYDSDEKTVSRADEVLLYNILDCEFSAPDGDTAEIYIERTGGNETNLVVCR